MLALLRRGLDAGGLLTITHDLALAKGLGGEILVMQGGTVVERGSAEQVLTAPVHPYTRALIAADPANWPSRAPAAEGPVLIEAKGLTVFRAGRQIFKPVDFTICRGQVLGVFGPSGCGKSSLGNAILGLLPYRGHLWRDPGVPKIRFQKLWQEPPAAFPRHLQLGQGLEELTTLHRIDRSRIEPLMDRLGLGPELLPRLPSEVSGGELQRVALLRALLLDPAFLFADEPTSRLDPVTQSETVQLLTGIAQELHTAVVIVSHDRALLEKTSHKMLFLESA